MRLIDADEFIKRNAQIIDCEIDHPKYQDTLRELIDDAPSIDIVKCEDCKYCSKGWVYARRKDGHEKIVNECRITRPPTSVKLDHYCGYGARRDNE